MKPRIDGAFPWSLFLGLVVLLFLIGARDFPEEVRIAPNLAGYPTLMLILVLLAGAFFPAIIHWTESTLQDLWGGGREGGGATPDAEAPAPWPAVLRVMGYAVGFLLGVILFGFFVVPPLFVTTFLIVEARVTRYKAILSAVIASTALDAGMLLLNVDVWTGIVPEIVEGYVGGAIMPPL